jgi:hypothetical protein
MDLSNLLTGIDLRFDQTKFAGSAQPRKIASQIWKALGLHAPEDTAKHATS